MEGAAANGFPGAISEGEKADRLDAFMAVQAETGAARLAGKVGRTLEVLVDEIGKDGVIARWAGDAPEIDGVVYLPGVEARPGDRLTVEIVASDEHDLEGRVLPKA